MAYDVESWALTNKTEERYCNRKGKSWERYKGHHVKMVYGDKNGSGNVYKISMSDILNVSEAHRLE